jgi:hypothetical protein
MVGSAHPHVKTRAWLPRRHGNHPNGPTGERVTSNESAIANPSRTPSAGSNPWRWRYLLNRTCRLPRCQSWRNRHDWSDSFIPCFRVRPFRAQGAIEPGPATSASPRQGGSQKNQFPESLTVPGHARVSLRRCVILDILLEIPARREMSNTAQKRALKNFRSRLQKKGLARFEVLGLDTDRSLIRSLANRLTQDDPDATRIRLEVTRTVFDVPRKGGILAALRRSPLAGEDIRIERPFDSGRKVDL